jgi:hypothetical protein
MLTISLTCQNSTNFQKIVAQNEQSVIEYRPSSENYVITISSASTGQNEFCSRYLENCPTPNTSKEPTQDEIQNEEFREKYFEKEEGITTNEITNTTTGAQSALSTAEPTNTLDKGETRVQNETSASSVEQGELSRKYEDGISGITIRYPSDWQIAKENSSVTSGERFNDQENNNNSAFVDVVSFFSPLRDSGLRILSSQKSSFSSTSPNLTNSFNSLIKKFSELYPDFQVINLNSNYSTTLRNSSGPAVPAYRIVFTFTSTESSSRNQQQILEPPDVAVRRQQQEQQFFPPDKPLFGMITAGGMGKMYIIEAYSEAFKGGEEQARKYSNNLNIPQKMIDSLELN